MRAGLAKKEPEYLEKWASAQTHGIANSKDIVALVQNACKRTVKAEVDKVEVSLKGCACLHNSQKLNKSYANMHINMTLC